MSSSSSSAASSPAHLRPFSLADIRNATNDFDEALMIRRGESWAVYKGTYTDYVGTKEIQKTVAVRCFNSKATPSWFDLEMEAWSQFSHKHIVPVIGYCHESGGPKILVYGYMSNGSLANHLCTKTTPFSFSLSWEQSLGICIGAARGLEYMHTRIKYSHDRGFYHGDVTATNILLDANGVAKISDLYSEPFNAKGMASFLDPEYQSISNVGGAQSSDVYTFGVILVKILSRKVMSFDEDENLGTFFQQCIRRGTVDLQIIHPDMKAQIQPNQLKMFLRIAAECLDPNRKKRPTMSKLVKKLEYAMASSSQRLCRRYSFHGIEKATNNFENIVGEGGEGKVYRGETETNIHVAVKLLKPERSSEFDKEVKMLSTFNHPNLVSLVGYCHESDQKALVYEWMCNGNLQTALRAFPLSWEQRLNICIGAARGLRHLHTGNHKLPKGIIHRDMKPSNILLDENFDAKISDFGLSKMSLCDQTTSEIATTFKGTIGYYAPEYHRDGKITRRIDVYAFGVILTEVLCGKKPWAREHSFYPTDQNEKYSYSLWAKENVDPHLKGAISPYCLESFTDVLEKCLNVDPYGRPSMNDVLSVLENALKWQEAWQRNDSGVLFYLPGGEDRFVLYYASNSEEVRRIVRNIPLLLLPHFSFPNLEEGTMAFQDSLRVRLFLRRFRVPIDERDPRNDLGCVWTEFKQVFGNTADVRLPKLFIRGKYVGGVEILNKTRELAKLLGVSSPRFVCRSCGEARSCAVCNQEEWYGLCRNCHALVKVSKECQGDLRSCLECDGEQLIYKANLQTDQHFSFSSFVVEPMPGPIVTNYPPESITWLNAILWPSFLTWCWSVFIVVFFLQVYRAGV